MEDLDYHQAASHLVSSVTLSWGIWMCEMARRTSKLSLRSRRDAFMIARFLTDH